MDNIRDAGFDGSLDETDRRAVTALLELALTVLRQDLSDESRQHIRWLLNR